jgi:hypothetical protein
MGKYLPLLLDGTLMGRVKLAKVLFAHIEAKKKVCFSLSKAQPHLASFLNGKERLFSVTGLCDL